MHSFIKKFAFSIIFLKASYKSTSIMLYASSFAFYFSSAVSSPSFNSSFGSVEESIYFSSFSSSFFFVAFSFFILSIAYFSFF